MSKRLNLILVNLEAKTKLELYKKQRDYMILRGQWVEMKNLKQHEDGTWSVQFLDDLFEHLKTLKKMEAK